MIRHEQAILLTGCFDSHTVLTQFHAFSHRTHSIFVMIIITNQSFDYEVKEIKKVNASNF